MLEFEGVTHATAAGRCSRGVDGSVRAGATALLGENGAGKTTLLECLVGLQQLAGGEIRMDGTILTTALSTGTEWHTHWPLTVGCVLGLWILAFSRGAVARGTA